MRDEGLGEMRRIIQEERESALTRVPVAEKRATSAASVGQIGLAMALCMSPLFLCLWVVLPFVSKKN